MRVLQVNIFKRFLKFPLGFFCCLLFLFSLAGIAQEKKEYTIRTIAFYNLENLFDTEDDPITYDEDRTPEGKDVWTVEKYQNKLEKMSKVISEIGCETAGNPPAIIGLCELENLKVLEDLIDQPALKNYNYGIIHFDSPDRRGVDVALLYRKSYFTPSNSQSRRLLLFEPLEPSKRIFTRDQLVVSGNFEGESMHFIVNHWPSRSGGEARSSLRREKAAWVNKQIIDSLFALDPYSKIITMGDFNDDPKNKSLKKVLNTKGKKEDTGFQELFNPMENLLKKGIGTLAYRDGWNLFDQIILSKPFVISNNGYQFFKAGIFNKAYLTTPEGQFKGYPFRSYDYGGYTGGYSDHFPVYVYLIREMN